LLIIASVIARVVVTATNGLASRGDRQSFPGARVTAAAVMLHKY
jgi:hypothetical protein